MISTLPPTIWLDSSQAGSGLASDDAVRNMSDAKSAADGIFLPGPIVIIDRTYTVDDDPADYVWRGFGERISTLIGANFDCDGAAFSGFRLQGNFDDTTPNGPMFAEDCQLDDFRGQINARQCRIGGVFRPVGYCVLEDCHFAQDSADAASAVQVDLTNCTGFTATRCHGRVEFVNRNSATGAYRLDGGGVVAFKSTLVQWSSFVLTGDWEVIERANGASAPLTDYSAGRARTTARAQAAAIFANSATASFTVSGAQSISDTAIEVTAGVQGNPGDLIMVRNTGEVMVITSASGTTFNVTRGFLGSVAQPISNGETIIVGLQRSQVVGAINFLIATIASLLGTTNAGIVILDGKLNVQQDLTRGLIESRSQFRSTLTASYTDSDTVLALADDPTGVFAAGTRMQNVRTGEVVLVGTVGVSSVTVTRGHAGTTAAAMTSGDRMVELAIAEDHLSQVLDSVDNVQSVVDTTFTYVSDLLALLPAIDRVTQLVLGIIAEESVALHVVSGFQTSGDTTIEVDDSAVTGVAVDDVGINLSSGEVVVVTSVGSGSFGADRGQFSSTAQSMQDDSQIAFLRGSDVDRAVTRILDLFVNNAETVDIGAGVRQVTIYEQDGVTIKHRVTISADGLTRTRIT